jgi:hypothetical protein
MGNVLEQGMAIAAPACRTRPTTSIQVAAIQITIAEETVLLSGSTQPLILTGTPAWKRAQREPPCLPIKRLCGPIGMTMCFLSLTGVSTPMESWSWMLDQ